MNTGMVNYGSALAAEQTAKADKTAQAEKKGKVTAGFVTSIIGICLWGIGLIARIIMIVI